MVRSAVREGNEIPTTDAAGLRGATAPAGAVKSDSLVIYEDFVTAGHKPRAKADKTDKTDKTDTSFLADFVERGRLSRIEKQQI